MDEMEMDDELNNRTGVPYWGCIVDELRQHQYSEDADEHIIPMDLLINAVEEYGKALEQAINELHGIHEFIASKGEDFFEDFHAGHSAYTTKENDDAVFDITLHISSAAYQIATCPVPISVIREGSNAVFHHIIGSNETEYSEYDYDDLSNDGLSWEKYSAELSECLSDNKAPSYLWNEPTEEE